MEHQRRVLKDALAIGLIGYAVVALFYSAFDVIAARSAFHTVDLLGRAAFRHLRDPSVLQFPDDLDAGAIFAYNALHLALALAIGTIVASLVALGERDTRRRRLVRAVIVLGYVVTVVAVGLLTAPLRAMLPWWSIMVANALAALAAGGYLVTKHPDLWRHLALVQP